MLSRPIMLYLSKLDESHFTTSPGVMPYIAGARGMRLNPKKCKEMLFNTLQYRLPIQTPLFIGDYTVESVKSFKLLGVNFSSDLTWSIHCECIIRKASKRLYIIHQLRKAGYCTKELVAIYCSLVRPILEYAAPVWAARPSHLSDSIETIQRRAMRIIFPNTISYSSALEAANLDPLYKRRADICEKFVSKNKQSGPLKSILNSVTHSVAHGYNLGSGNTSDCSIIP